MSMYAPETRPDAGLDLDTTDLAFYGLRMQPFQPAVDARFRWLGVRHRLIITELQSAIDRSSGLLILTGDAGIGKTTLTAALIESLDQEVDVATVQLPDSEPSELLRAVAEAFRLPTNFGSWEALLAALHETRPQHHKALLVIDDAHRLSGGLLDEIQRLCRPGTADGEPGPESALNVLLVGQQELEAVLAEPRQATQRWTVQALTPEEVGAYIAHRVRVCGASQNPFTAGAAYEVWALSGGVPRLVNALCERALLAGGQHAYATIDPDVVAQGAGRLGRSAPLPGELDRAEPPTAGAPRSSLARAAAGIAAGLALVVLTLTVARYFHSPGQTGTPALTVAADLTADVDREPKAPESLSESTMPISAAAPSVVAPVGVESGGAAPDGAARFAVGMNVGLQAATPPGPAESAKEPPVQHQATARPAESRPGRPESRRLPNRRRVAGMAAAPVVPAAGAAAGGSAIVEQPPAVPQPQPTPAGGVTPAPVPPGRSGAQAPPAAEGADPDPTAVIDWLLNERAARQR